jgi:hypothetical protein
MSIIMIHCFAVDPPIAHWSIACFLHLSTHCTSEEKHHLEPYILPTEIANRIITVDGNFLGSNWWDLHDFLVNEVCELVGIHLSKYVLEYLFGCDFLSYEVIA